MRRSGAYDSLPASGPGRSDRGQRQRLARDRPTLRHGRSSTFRPRFGLFGPSAPLRMMFSYARGAAEARSQVIIAGARPARLPEHGRRPRRSLPVIGVPGTLATSWTALTPCCRSLQMPAGVPVATVIHRGRRYCQLLAVRMLGSRQPRRGPGSSHSRTGWPTSWQPGCRLQQLAGELTRD